VTLAVGVVWLTYAPELTSGGANLDEPLLAAATYSVEPHVPPLCWSMGHLGGFVHVPSVGCTIMLELVGCVQAFRSIIHWIFFSASVRGQVPGL
jgi:hypothetical protein